MALQPGQQRHQALVFEPCPCNEIGNWLGCLGVARRKCRFNQQSGIGRFLLDRLVLKRQRQGRRRIVFDLEPEQSLFPQVHAIASCRGSGKTFIEDR